MQMPPSRSSLRSAARPFRHAFLCSTLEGKKKTRSNGILCREMANQYRILCPCCEAAIIVDAQTGAIISHEEKKKVTASFDEMKKDLEKQRQARDQIFTQELGSVKDRERLLEEKFREALKKAGPAGLDKPFRNPLDLD